MEVINKIFLLSFCLLIFSQFSFLAQVSYLRTTIKNVVFHYIYQDTIYGSIAATCAVGLNMLLQCTVGGKSAILYLTELQ
jgi:hypothetical protein